MDVIAELEKVESPSQFERLFYEKNEGRISRQEAKRITSKLFQCARLENQREAEAAKAIMLDVIKHCFNSLNGKDLAW